MKSALRKENLLHSLRMKKVVEGSRQPSFGPKDLCWLTIPKGRKPAWRVPGLRRKPTENLNCKSKEEEQEGRCLNERETGRGFGIIENEMRNSQNEERRQIAKSSYGKWSEREDQSLFNANPTRSRDCGEKEPKKKRAPVLTI